MLNNKSFIVVTLFTLVIVTNGCQKANKEQSILWGKTYTYTPFLWKKQTPDTLKQVLCFDFNEDAKKYLDQPLKLGIYKKTQEGKSQQVQADEMELFINGQRIDDNIIAVRANEKEMEIGVVFSEKAKNMIHYWYIKPISDVGLDRINNREIQQDEAIMEIRIQKCHVMNPLKKGMMWFLIGSVVIFLLWTFLLKAQFFPTFKVSSLSLTGPPPYLRLIKIKGCRKCILTNNHKNQNWLNFIFTGKIHYEINSIWSADVTFEPRDNNSVYISLNNQIYSINTRTLIRNTQYNITNNTTNNITNIKII